MLLSPHIVKVEPGHFRAHVMDGREELGTFDTISISAAIREAAGHSLPDLSGYHVGYEHVCAGTCTRSNMRIDPEGLAQRLMALHGQFKSLAGLAVSCGLHRIHWLTNARGSAMISAQETFAQVVAALPACLEEESTGPAQKVVQALRFQQEDHSDRQILCFYRYTDAAGDSVTLKDRWHDPSGPFQNVPDIHRVRVTLAVRGMAEVERMSEWQD